MSERRAIQSIAPAGDSRRMVKPFEDVKPLKVSEPKSRVERLSMSKQWVLPPRPKPGRKPKAATEKAAKAGAEKGTKGAVEKAAKPAKPVSASYNRSDSATDRKSVKTDSKDSKQDVDGDSCGLCSRDDGCVCEEIGFRGTPSAKASPITHSPTASLSQTDHKSKSSISLPSLDTILNQSTIKMDAVPIKRNGNGNSNDRLSTGSAAPMSKFKKAFTFEPMHPSPVMSIPSPLEGIHMNSETGCGFCSENTVCICADTAGNQSSGSGQGYSQQSTQSASAVTPMSSTSQHRSVQLPPPRTLDADSVQLDDDVYGCSECERGPMSMLFCVSLSAAKQLPPGAVAIPCNLAFKTLQKHHKFDGCDLGKLVRRLECSKKMVGVQSINRVLQEMEHNEFVPQS